MDKKVRKAISIILVLFILVFSFAFIKISIELDKQKETNSTTVSIEYPAEFSTITKETIGETTTLPETTTEEPSVMETTTKKPVSPETTTKAPVETTTKPKPTETTTKQSDIAFNGHKPYEIFIHPVSGKEVYYDENGRLCLAEVLTTAPPEDSNDECPWCGEKNCGAFMESWYCVICEKNIAAHECHPKSHLDASR